MSNRDHVPLRYVITLITSVIQKTREYDPPNRCILVKNMIHRTKGYELVIVFLTYYSPGLLIAVYLLPASRYKIFASLDARPSIRLAL